MLDFIKKLFKKEEELLIEKKDLKKFFDENVKLTKEEIDTKVTSIKQRVKEKLIALDEAHTSLKDARLLNAKITTREIQFMEGNRDFFLQRTKQFKNNIEDLLNKPFPFLEQEFTKELNSFAKSTARAYHILQEFFVSESQKIAGKIKELEKEVLTFKGDPLIKKKSAINSINAKFASMHSLKEKESGLKSEKQTLGKELEKIKKDIESVTESEKALHASDNYQSYKEKKSQKQKTEDLIKLEKNAIYQLFSAFDKALRKYEHIAIENTELIGSYIKDPTLALIKDDNLQFLTVLERISKEVSSNSLQLKDKDKEKFLSNYKTLDKVEIKRHAKKAKDLLNTLDSVNETLAKMQIEKRQEELIEVKELLLQRKTEFERRCQDIKDAINTLSKEKIEKEIIKDLKEFLGKKIEIKD